MIPVIQTEPLDRQSIVRWLDELVALDRALCQELGEIAFPQPWGPENFLLDLPGKWELSCVCTDGHHLQGFWINGVPTPGMAHLYRMGWKKELRGRGLAATSYDDVRERIRIHRAHLNLEWWTLEVNRCNQRAIQFYQRVGFELLEGKALRDYLELLPRKSSIQRIENDGFHIVTGQQFLVFYQTL
jgi:ribosomal protein S18 acetylase RimI-like enzyme